MCGLTVLVNLERGIFQLVVLLTFNGFLMLAITDKFEKITLKSSCLYCRCLLRSPLLLRVINFQGMHLLGSSQFTKLRKLQ